MGKHPQGLVAGRMPVPIVELLEVIEVEHQDRQRFALRAIGQCPLQDFIERSAVGQSRPPVGVRLPAERQEQASVRDRQRGVLADTGDGEPERDRQLAGRGPVEMCCAHRFTQRDQWDASQRAALDRIYGTVEGEALRDIVGHVEAAPTERGAATQLVKREDVSLPLAQRGLRNRPILGSVRHVQCALLGFQQLVERRHGGHRERDVVLGERSQLAELVDDRSLTRQLGACLARLFEARVRARQTMVEALEATLPVRGAAGEPAAEQDHKQDERTSGDRQVQERPVDVGVELIDRTDDRHDSVGATDRPVARPERGACHVKGDAPSLTRQHLARRRPPGSRA
jgi:hypothetical protein